MADSKLITIVIAHRLSTIRGANKICYMEHGKICEVGTHEELMAIPNSKYKRLDSLQTLDDEWHDRQSMLEIQSDIKRTTTGRSSTNFKKIDVTEEGSLVTEENKKSKEYKKKAQQVAKDEYYLFFLGSIGAFMNGIM